MLIPPKGYLERLREITSKHGILLIFDEVITGFGRLGANTASDYFGVTPDVITMAKGISNAAVPAGAVAVTNSLYDTVVNASENGIELFHGYTYSGHPMAMAAIGATLALYQSEGIFDNARKLSPAFEAAAHALNGLPNVIDVRNLGIVAGVELAPRENAPGARAAEVFQRCYDAGVLVRYTGDTIALSPPLIVNEEQINTLFDVLGQAISQTA